jgi:hypothetical protein
MPNRLGFIASILLSAAAVSPALADAIGNVTQVARKASADASGARRDLDVGSDVAAKDTVVTDTVGKAALRFVDDTQLSIGPNSSVRLDNFVFNRSSDASSFVIRATRGAFRFVTGRGDHDGYRIHTPTATLGVRGTQFDVKIEGKQVRVSVLEGEVVLCPIAGRPNFVDCTEAVAGQSILSSRTRANVVPTSSLPQLRADLLPLSTLANASSSLLPTLPTATDALGNTLGGATSAATSAAGAASSAASGALGGLGSATSAASGSLDSTGGNAAGALGGLGNAAGTLGGVGNATGNIGGALGGVGGAAAGLGGTVGRVGGGLGGLGSGLGGGLGGALGAARIGR